jgi:glycosyltransferase 2 family protein
VAVRRLLLNWKALLGLGISLALLYLALRGIDPGHVLHEIRNADPFLFAAAVVAATVPFAIRAIRWGALLEPVRPGSRFGPRFTATSIGFMGNNLLPARMGEFARAYVYSRVERIPLTASFGSMVVERIFDAFVLFLLLFAAMAMPGFPGIGRVEGWNVGGAALGILAGVAAVLVALLAMVLWPRRTVLIFEALAARLLPRALRRPVVDALEAFLRGIQALREPRLIVRALLWSLVVWAMGALSFWLGFRAFDIDVPFYAAFFLQSVVALSVSLPSAPGFFGTFEYGVRLGLVDVFGVEMNKAMGFAIGFHLGGFITITLIGLYFVWRLGLTWRELEESEEIVEREWLTEEEVGDIERKAHAKAEHHRSNDSSARGPPPVQPHDHGDEYGASQEGGEGNHHELHDVELAQRQEEGHGAEDDDAHAIDRQLARVADLRVDQPGINVIRERGGGDEENRVDGAHNRRDDRGEDERTDDWGQHLGGEDR